MCLRDRLRSAHVGAESRTWWRREDARSGDMLAYRKTLLKEAPRTRNGMVNIGVRSSGKYQAATLLESARKASEIACVHAASRFDILEELFYDVLGKTAFT